MNGRLVRLAARIRDELTELDRVAGRVAEGWARALRNGDDYYLDRHPCAGPHNRG